MRRSLLRDELVLGPAVHVALSNLLKARLGADGLSCQCGRDLGAERRHDELMRGAVSGVKVERSHQRLVDVLKRGVHTPGARALLGLPHHDERSHAEPIGNAGEHLAGDEADLCLCECALVHVREALEKVRGNNGPQDGVAEKLKTLVGRRDGTSFGCRRVRERGLYELLSLEVVGADPLRLDHSLVHLQRSGPLLTERPRWRQRLRRRWQWRPRRHRQRS